MFHGVDIPAGRGELPEAVRRPHPDEQQVPLAIRSFAAAEWPRAWRSVAAPLPPHSFEVLLWNSAAQEEHG